MADARQRPRLCRAGGLHHQDLVEGVLGERDHPGERAVDAGDRHLPEPAGEHRPREDLLDADHGQELHREDPRARRERPVHGRRPEAEDQRGRDPGHDARPHVGRGVVAGGRDLARLGRRVGVPAGRPPGRRHPQRRPGQGDPGRDHPDLQRDRLAETQRPRPPEDRVRPARPEGAHRPARADPGRLGASERQRQPLRAADGLVGTDPPAAGAEHRRRRDARAAARDPPRLAAQPPRPCPALPRGGGGAARGAGARGDPAPQEVRPRGQRPLGGLRRAPREPRVPLPRPGAARGHVHELQPGRGQDLIRRRARLRGGARRDERAPRRRRRPHEQPLDAVRRARAARADERDRGNLLAGRGRARDRPGPLAAPRRPDPAEPTQPALQRADARARRRAARAAQPGDHRLAARRPPRRCVDPGLDLRWDRPRGAGRGDQPRRPAHRRGEPAAQPDADHRDDRPQPADDRRVLLPDPYRGPARARVRRLSQRARIGLAGAALIGPLVAFPTLLRPNLAIGLCIAVAVAFLASRSVAYPLALWGLPGVFLAFLGSNPFPKSSIQTFLVGWLVLGIVLTLLREENALPLRLVLSGPVLLTLGTAVLMLARLGASNAQDYGSFKLQLFLAQNVPYLVAGVIVGRHRRHLNTFTGAMLATVTLGSLVLLRGILTGGVADVLPGRFALVSQSGPISLARGAAAGLLLAVFVLLVSAVPWQRTLALASIPILAVAFLGAGSRGPVVGLAAGLLILFALTLGDGRSRRRLV